MLTVIKKRGNKQPFDAEKIMISINNAARDADLILTKKETELMAKDVERHIISIRGKDGVTNSYEIRALVRLVLQEFGFPQIVQSFERGKVNDFSDIERHRQAIAEHQACLDELLRAQTEADSIHEDREPVPEEPDEDPIEKAIHMDHPFANMKTEHHKKE